MGKKLSKHVFAGKDEVEGFNDSKEGKRKSFKTSYEIIQDYSQYATIQGLIYIFSSYQSWFGKLFWMLVIVLMSCLGLYWCTQAYMDWRKQPVLTTVTTTAYPIQLVKKPFFN